MEKYESITRTLPKSSNIGTIVSGNILPKHFHSLCLEVFDRTIGAATVDCKHVLKPVKLQERYVVLAAIEFIKG